MHQGRAPLRRGQRGELSCPKGGLFVEIYRAGLGAAAAGPIEFGERRHPHRSREPRPLRTASGRSWSWHRLISTMPLARSAARDRGAARKKDLIVDAEQAGSLFRSRSSMLVIGQRLGEQPQRIYVSDPQVPNTRSRFNQPSSPSLGAARGPATARHV